jgi:hypothetical protein
MHQMARSKTSAVYVLLLRSFKRALDNGYWSLHVVHSRVNLSEETLMCDSKRRCIIELWFSSWSIPGRVLDFSVDLVTEHREWVIRTERINLMEISLPLNSRCLKVRFLVVATQRKLRRNHSLRIEDNR